MKARALIALVLVWAAGFVRAAENGVTADEIVLGQSCALSGPAQDLGIKMRAGLLACFQAVNDRGGVKGRRIRLISKDDGYEPDVAIKNTRELIEQDKVFALIGEVGTPTSKAALPIAEEAGVPFIAPFTGAEFLRSPFRKYVINIRAGYYQEMERLAQYLVDKKGLKKVACFYQNDSFGQAGLDGIEKALAKRGLALVARGSYERNTLAVKAGLLEIRPAEPEAVVLVGAYGPCAEFIKLAKQLGMTETIFCNVSFVGTTALMSALGDAAEGVIVSEVVPNPHEPGLPIVAEYKAAMQKYQPDVFAGFIALEGYIAGKLFCQAVERVQGELTRENLIRTIEETGVFDVGGLQLRFGPQDHQGMDEVFLVVSRGGRLVTLTEE